METLLQLKNLSTEDKLRAMELLWDDLRQGSSSVAVPAWHKTELAARGARVRSGKAKFSDWDDAKVRLRARKP
jgi:hypothetical protein